MKKLLFVILSLFAVVAYADNTITSKEYVDGQVSNLQTQIPAKNTNTVLTNTGTAGTIGEKAIYDTTAAYGAQSDALVTAGAFNTAVQNALESEFVCVEWQGEVHDNAHCLLYEVRGATHKPSGKNLFDINSAKIIFKAGDIGVIKNPTGYTLQPSQVGGYEFILVEFGNISDFIGKTLSIYASSTTCENHPTYFLGYSNDDGTIRQATFMRTLSITEPSSEYTKLVFWLYPYAGTDQLCDTYSNIQVEEGSVATEYEPYQNLYLPSSN